ncbi:unnamed protein product [Musa acuminata subsp. burmannicoides]
MVGANHRLPPHRRHPPMRHRHRNRRSVLPPNLDLYKSSKQWLLSESETRLPPPTKHLLLQKWCR